VEIRNQLTLELITILQPPETIPHLTDLLAYSPDGRSIACTSDTAIIIWDIQTGGVAKEITCSAKTTSLVWSSNGGSICTLNSEYLRTFTVNTHDVSSGTASSPGTLESICNPHLWTVDESFWIMTIVCIGYIIETVDIFEVGSTLTRIQSFSPRSLSATGDTSFSPTTYHISILKHNELSIFDVRSSEYLLHITGQGEFDSQYFSSDGSLFAASQDNIVYVWKYDSGHYALCGKFGFQCLLWYSLQFYIQFPPTPSSSILSHFENILRVSRLYKLPTTPETHRRQYVGLSHSGTRVATAREMESTVTTTDILAQTPPQIIDAGVAIEGLALTGNVLLVVGSGQVVAWLLTEEGLVDGVIGDRRVGRGDSIWTVPFPSYWKIGVEGQIGVVQTGYWNKRELQVYRTDTGEILHPTQAPHSIYDNPPGVWDSSHRVMDRFNRNSLCRNHLHFHNLSRYNTSLEGRWKTSPDTVQEGWVKDAEGRHRLWIPAEWRTYWDPEDWLHDVTIQLSHLGGRPVLVKF